MSFADDIADWMKRELKATQGDFIGQPFVVLDWEYEILEALEHNRYFGFSIARSNGKALALSTPILTGEGWKTMGTIAAGDHVFAPDGSLTEVVAAHDVLLGRPCYRVDFDTKESIVADGDHFWRTLTAGSPPQVRTTEEILCSLSRAPHLIDAGKFGHGRPEHFCIADIQPVPSEPVRCITVAHEDGLYLVGDSLIPTHNTSFIAALAVAAIRPDGPLFQPRGEVLLIASALKQVDVAFQHIKHMMWKQLHTADGKQVSRLQWKQADNHHDKSITHVPTGTQLIGLGSDNKRAHGRAPSFAMLDEPAQMLGGGEAMYNAIVTGMGKQPNPKLFAIGTQSDDPQHWFQRLLKSSGKLTWTKVYAADKGDDAFAKATIRKANPSYDHIPALRAEVQSKVDMVREGALTIHAFRALHLNMGTPELEGQELLIDAEDWDRIITPGPIKREGRVAIAFDLGENKSMSAAALYWAETGWLETFGAFPTKPHLLERGRRDGVETLYLEMEKRGEIFLSGEYKVDNVDFVQTILEKVGSAPRIGGILADHFQHTTIMQVVSGLGMDPENDVEIRRAARGSHGKEDIDAFRSEVLTEYMKVEDNLALNLAVSNSVISRGFNANPGLDKRKQKGRIDMVQAAVLAVGAGFRFRKPPEKPYEFNIDDFML